MIEIASKSDCRSSRLLMSDDNVCNLSRIISSTFRSFSPSCRVPNAVIALRNGSCHCGYLSSSLILSPRCQGTTSLGLDVVCAKAGDLGTKCPPKTSEKRYEPVSLFSNSETMRRSGAFFMFFTAICKKQSAMKKQRWKRIECLL